MCKRKPGKVCSPSGFHTIKKLITYKIKLNKQRAFVVTRKRVTSTHVNIVKSVARTRNVRKSNTAMATRQDAQPAGTNPMGSRARTIPRFCFSYNLMYFLHRCAIMEVAMALCVRITGFVIVSLPRANPRIFANWRARKMEVKFISLIKKDKSII